MKPNNASTSPLRHLTLLLSISYIAALAYMIYLLPDVWQQIIAIYSVFINAVAMLFTWQDKTASIDNKPRISELRFYVLACCGGWLGSYLIQRLRRHKTQKQPFKTIFWLCALFNILVVCGIYWKVISALQ